MVGCLNEFENQSGGGEGMVWWLGRAYVQINMKIKSRVRIYGDCRQLSQSKEGEAIQEISLKRWSWMELVW